MVLHAFARPLGRHTASLDAHGGLGTRAGARVGLGGAVRGAMRGSIPLDFAKIGPSTEGSLFLDFIYKSLLDPAW